MKSTKTRARTRARRHADQELPEAGAAVFTLRQMSELPYQETRAEMWGPLFETLTNFRFLEKKSATGAVETRAADGGTVTASYAGIFAIHDDFELALAEMPAAAGVGDWRSDGPGHPALGVGPGDDEIPFAADIEM